MVYEAIADVLAGVGHILDMAGECLWGKPAAGEYFNRNPLRDVFYRAGDWVYQFDYRARRRAMRKLYSGYTYDDAKKRNRRAEK